MLVTKTDPDLHKRVQQLAGRVLLNCLRLEESLKVLLSAMARLRAGELDPEDAKPILAGSSKLAAGQLYKKLRPHIQTCKNWTELVEQALEARNKLVHSYPFSRWAKISSAASLKRFESEVRPLELRVQAGVNAVGAVIEGIAEFLMKELPAAEVQEIKRAVMSRLHDGTGTVIESRGCKSSQS